MDIYLHLFPPNDDTDVDDIHHSSIFLPYHHPCSCIQGQPGRNNDYPLVGNHLKDKEEDINEGGQWLFICLPTIPLLPLPHSAPCLPFMIYDNMTRLKHLDVIYLTPVTI